MSILSIIMICAVAVLGIIDIKKKSVSVPVLIGMLIFCVIWNLVTGDKSHVGMLIGALPAILLFLLCKVSRMRIGIGDIFLTAVIGVALGADSVCVTLLAASVICAAVTGILLALKKISRDYTIAFIPFLGAGMVVSGLIA